MTENLTTLDKVLANLQNPSLWNYCIRKLLLKNKIVGSDREYLETLLTTEHYKVIIPLILDGTYNWSIPRKIEIAKIGSSKKRIVYIHDIQDRVILSVLNEAYSDAFKDEISKSVFSYRENERTLSAVKSLLKDQTIFTKYAVKLDISSYFNSVSESSLKDVVDDKLSPTSGIHKLLTNLLFYNKAVKTRCNHETGEVISLNVIDEYMSLIPGSSFSSFLANYILKDIDEWLESLSDITYARYSDDMIIFSDNKEHLTNLTNLLLEKLSKFGLTVNPDKYTYYNPGDVITFLGLVFWRDRQSESNQIDIASKTAKKLKSKIHHMAKEARRRVEQDNKNPYKEISKVIAKFNNLIYRSYLFEEGKYGWAYYVFNNINTTKTLRELDFYLVDTLRYIYTGKHNTANISKVSKETLYQLGMKSFIEMYNFFKIDKQYYREKVYEISPVFVDQIELFSVVKSF